MDDFDLSITQGPFILFLPDIFKKDLVISNSSFLNDLTDVVSVDVAIDVSIDVPAGASTRTEDDSEFDLDALDVDDLSDDDSIDASDLSGLQVINAASLYTSHVREEPCGIVEPIPVRYYSQKSWPKSTGLKCWACGCVPPEKVWSIPVMISKMAMQVRDDIDEIVDPSAIEDDIMLKQQVKSKQVDVKKMHGVFCNVACMGRHIKHSNDPIIANKWQCKEFVKDLYLEWEDKRLIDVPVSSNPWEMKKFTGIAEGLTEQQYYDKNIDLINMHTP